MKRFLQNNIWRSHRVSRRKKSVEDRFPHTINPDLHEQFIDNVVIPALETIDPPKAAMYPLCMSAEKARLQNSRGQFIGAPIPLPRTHLRVFVDVLRSLVSENPELEIFQDFFFCSCTYGTKARFSPSSNVFTQLKSIYFDLDFQGVPPANVIFDLATNFFGSPSRTLIWRINHRERGVRKLKGVFDVLLPGDFIAAADLVIHPFMGFQSLGGFKWKCPDYKSLGINSLLLPKPHEKFM